MSTWRETITKGDSPDVRTFSIGDRIAYSSGHGEYRSETPAGCTLIIPNGALGRVLAVSGPNSFVCMFDDLGGGVGVALPWSQLAPWMPSDEDRR